MNGNSAQCPLADCNVPEGECSGECLPKADGPITRRRTIPPFAQTPLDTQIGGAHYKELGDYQPWEVLKHWLTPEEFRGYIKGTAIAYLAREAKKGGDQDIAKADHTLQGLLHLTKESADV